MWTHFLTCVLFFFFSCHHHHHHQPTVNYTNILRAAFAPISFCQKNTNLSRKFKKAAQKTFCTKKLLVKCWWNWNLALNTKNWSALNNLPSVPKIGAIVVPGKMSNHYLITCYSISFAVKPNLALPYLTNLPSPGLTLLVAT